MKQLEAKYDHQKVETGKYDHWVEKGYFTAGDKSKEPFTVVIPPPNVTGKLHLGHAWDNTLQDIVCRYKRMQGFDVLFLPGMDHAGIATQAKVDARLKEQHLSRYDLGREKFLEKAWEWKEEYAKTIHEQWKKLGNGIDYSRERFTLDEGLNEAVRTVFVKLYEEGLIYQGWRIINWDPEAQTALSNIEVEYQEDPGKMYYFKYTVVENGKTFTVATTRPETMFGDVCVVVHPEDERYQDLVGCHVTNPANGEVLPIITDEYIDISFGTGAMKCTPAHDPNDFAIAERHHLEKPICMNPDGTMNARAQSYEGLDRYACRDLVVKKIEEEGNLVKIEDLVHNVGHSERTHAVVEPYLSKQWFVKMKPLAQAVLDAQKDPNQKINFYPARFEKIFTQWLENIEDWCISRQLWWGHRIPAWYHKETGEVYVGMEEPKDPENWVQDEDVLDTWFSSALWPFSTLGWPEKTEDFLRYYPTQTMATGYDIIFFWVARMAFQARHFTDSYPFKDCLIHGLIRDEEGRKMAKSLGNGIDPMDVIEQYGVDALRFFLTTNSTPGQDTRYVPAKMEASWNFINKLWNASRFVLMNLPEDYTYTSVDPADLSDSDVWILTRYNETLNHIETNMNRYEFALVGNELYGFIWDDFCSWYIELSKASLNNPDEKIKAACLNTLVTVLMGIVKMLSPFMPFVTEEIYQALPHDKESICIESWPEASRAADPAKSVEVTRVIEIVQNIRQTKLEYNLKPSAPLTYRLLDREGKPIVLSTGSIASIEKLTKCTIQMEEEGESVVRPSSFGSILYPANLLSNKEEEQAKLQKEKERLEKEIERSKGMLGNERFMSKAPQAKVDEEKAKMENYAHQLEVVVARLEELSK